MPDRVRATRRLTQAQAQAWSDWSEASLQAGALPCTTTVWTAGSGAEAVTAYVTGTPTFDAAPGGGLWTLTVDLLLQDVVADAGFAGVGGWTLPWPPAFPPEDDWEGGTGGGVTEPALALLRFDALPLVDEVSTNAVTDELNLQLSNDGAVSGTALDMEVMNNPAGVTWYDRLQTAHVAGGAYTRALTTPDFTIEMFVSRSAGWTVQGGPNAWFELLITVNLNFYWSSGVPNIRALLEFEGTPDTNGELSAKVQTWTGSVNGNPYQVILNQYAPPYVDPPMLTSTPKHVAMVSTPDELRLYFDGALVGTGYSFTPERYPLDGLHWGRLLIQTSVAGGNECPRIDELRVSEGALYTGTSFTPPTGPFPPPP
jgi:hypothetical protein